MRISSLSRAFAILVLTGFVLSSCSLLYDLSPDQCESTSDCQSFGRGFTCQSGVCACVQASCAATGGNAGTSGESNGGTSGDAGEGNAGTETGGTGLTGGGGTTAGADTGGTAGTGGMPEPPECQGHNDCTDAADPKACVEGKCVLLRTDECPILLPRKANLWESNLSDPDAIILGAFTQIPAATLNSNQIRNFDLAVMELSETVGGFAARIGTRPVVMVVCHSIYDTREQLRVPAAHLIDTLKVPGIVSELEPDDLAYVFNEFAVERGVFFMSTSPPDVNLVNLADDGLVWHALSGSAELGVAYKPLLTRTIEHLRNRAEPALGETEDVRVALVTATGVRPLAELGQTIVDTIEFNGMSATDNETNFQRMTVVSVYEQGNAPQGPLAAALRTFAPHVIVAMGANEILRTVIPLVEAGWASANPDQAKPFYLLSPYHYNSGDMVPLVSGNADLSTRIAGVNWPAAEDPTVYNQYLDAFDQANPDVAGRPETRGYENYYDAAYYLLYAIAGAGTPAVMDGAAISRGMVRLFNGTAYNVGASQMPAAFATLRQSGAKITLTGTMGPPNFDEMTGARLDAGSVWCYHNAAFVPDVLRYDPSDESLAGTFPCVAEF